MTYSEPITRPPRIGAKWEELGEGGEGEGEEESESDRVDGGARAW